MKPIIRLFKSCSLSMLLLTTIAASSQGNVIQGERAPAFSLKDIKGKTYDLSMLNKQPMSILYFFDTESSSSQEGLLNLDQLFKDFKNVDLKVWGITTSSSENVLKFVSKAKPGFPILLDIGEVSQLYNARFILPAVSILGPELEVLDIFQGGGKTTEVMMVRLAERNMQRKSIQVARAISKQVKKKNPENFRAKAVIGYAALNEGNLNEAEDVFHHMVSEKGEAGIIGKEGLAEVYYKKGQDKKAMAMVSEVESKAPDRSYVHVIKGNLLYRQNKELAASEEYQKATEKKITEPYHKAVGYNQLGRYYASKGDFQQSRKLYDTAIAMDPYYIEATSNKGMTYEKEGNWGKALETYNHALTINKSDTFAAVLAEKAEEMVSLKTNVEKKKRIDKLVKDLAARYHEQKSLIKSEDSWTSRPMIMTFVDFQEKGGLAERDGISSVLATQLCNTLNKSGRVQVVERVVMERLLEELNLGSSELADPETALKLGRVLAAKLIGTGSLFYMPNGMLLNLRLVDTETSAVPQVLTHQIASLAYLTKEIKLLNREILKTVIEKYPLKGYLIQEENGRVMINLGARHGVMLGTNFEVIEEKKPIKYKGKLLNSRPKVVALLKVTQVEPDLSFAKIVSKKRQLKKDDKVMEKIDDLMAMVEQ